MNVIYKERGLGKTTDLIKLSAKTLIPIVCIHPEVVQEQAVSLGLVIPTPLTPGEFMSTKPRRVYVDELPFIFEWATGTKIEACTVSADC